MKTQTDRLLDEITIYKLALKEIQRGSGHLGKDQLEHAHNTIIHLKTAASRALNLEEVNYE